MLLKLVKVLTFDSVVGRRFAWGSLSWAHSELGTGSVLLRYMYTTAKSVAAPDNMPAVLAGYGYGLPVTRLYAKYFGGDLQIISMEGYGQAPLRAPFGRPVGCFYSGHCALQPLVDQLRHCTSSVSCSLLAQHPWFFLHEQ